MTDTQTKKQILPYQFVHLIDGRVTIHNTNGQRLTVTREQVERQLQRDDLDVHRRRMYEATLREFDGEQS